MSTADIAHLIYNQYDDTGARVESYTPTKLVVRLPLDYPAATSLFVDIAALNGEVDMIQDGAETKLTISIAPEETKPPKSFSIKKHILFVIAMIPALMALVFMLSRSLSTTRSTPTYHYAKF